MNKLPEMTPPEQISPRRSFLRLAVGAGTGVVLGGGLLAACGGGEPEPAAGREQRLEVTTLTCAPQQYPVAVLGGGATVATMTVSNTASNLELSFAAAAGCTMSEVFVWVGNDPTLVPTLGGVPHFPDFPHKITVGAPNTAAALSLLLTSLSLPTDPCTQPLYIFAKVISPCGFGWATGTPSAGSIGGIPYVSYRLCGLDCKVLNGCETAFAKGGYVFTTDSRSNPESLPTLGLTRNRWGWAIELTSIGSTTYPIYAGAGLNRVANATQVGTLTIVWDGANAAVTYALNAGVTMTEAHLYAGDSRPTTIAPGQFGNIASFATPVSSHTFTVPLADTGDVGGVWLVAHAVVC